MNSNALIWPRKVAKVRIARTEFRGINVTFFRLWRARTLKFLANQHREL